VGPFEQPISTAAPAATTVNPTSATKPAFFNLFRFEDVILFIMIPATILPLRLLRVALVVTGTRK
jgi:hypothetical protein